MGRALFSERESVPRGGWPLRCGPGVMKSAAILWILLAGLGGPWQCCGGAMVLSYGSGYRPIHTVGEARVGEGK